MPRVRMRRARSTRATPGRAAGLAAALVTFAAAAFAQDFAREEGQAMVTLDFADAELAQVIETIARATNRNFIYDDRVRGRVTIVSPEPIPVEQAYAVFESVLQVKGFTTVTTPGGAIKVIPVREAKESSIETVQSSRRPPDRDRFVTRLIPLNYIDADSIVETLKPLVSKDAAMAAYAPTNTVILTESASNIRRLIAILESIDVETYKEELAVINVDYADAATLAEQVSEIYGAEVSQGPATTRRAARRRTGAQADATTAAHKPPVRILTDERTNSLLVLAPRAQLEEVRRLVAKLDVPVSGGGRIHVYYLNNANAEELAETLSGLISGQPRSTTATTTTTAAGTTPGAPAIRSAVTGLAGSITVSADPATNSLIIQATQEGFNTLAQVIEKLDVERPQVSVEALIMELTVSDTQGIGFSGVLQAINGDSNFLIASATSAAGAATGVPVALGAAGPLLGQVVRDSRDIGADGEREGSGSVIDTIIDLSATNGDINIVSAPHILTSDNEEAEIRVGDNIPIISSRVESAAGLQSGLNTSVNVERQDIGVTLRVTPQITEGDSLRLDIFQEITAINSGLQSGVGNSEDVGVALSNRRVENTVVVRDGETVVIGGLLSDQLDDSVTKVPWLGDIPILGWLFRSTRKEVRKTNLLVFLTPRIVRTPLDLERDTIRRREEFRERSGRSVELSEADLEIEAERLAMAEAEGLPYLPRHYDKPIRERLAAHRVRYPNERMAEIERIRGEERAASVPVGREEPRYLLQAAVLGDPDAAARLLTDLIDSGHDGTLVSTQVGESVIYEVDLGPYSTLQEANLVGEAVRRSHGLTPAIVVLEEEDRP